MEHESDNYTVIDTFGTVTKGLSKGLVDLEIGGRVETIQNTTLLRTAKILRRVQEICCHSSFREIPSTNTDVKNSQGINDKCLRLILIYIMASIL